MMHTYHLLVTNHEGEVFRGLFFEDVSEREAYRQALSAWRAHDDARLAGQRPHVKHYEVRDGEDPKVQDARHPSNITNGGRYAALWTDVTTPRGFGEGKGLKSAKEKAARAAIHQFPKRRDIQQGDGGWYWDPHAKTRRTLAQGLHHLAEIAERRGWIVKGVDNRWYATEMAR